MEETLDDVLGRVEDDDETGDVVVTYELGTFPLTRDALEDAWAKGHARVVAYDTPVRALGLDGHLSREIAASGVRTVRDLVVWVGGEEAHPCLGEDGVATVATCLREAASPLPSCYDGRQVRSLTSLSESAELVFDVLGRLCLVGEGRAGEGDAEGPVPCDEAVEGAWWAADTCRAHGHVVFPEAFAGVMAIVAEDALGTGAGVDAYRDAALAAFEAMPEVLEECRRLLLAALGILRGETMPSAIGVHEYVPWGRAAEEVAATDGRCTWDASTHTLSCGRMNLDEWVHLSARDAREEAIVRSLLEGKTYEECAERHGVGVREVQTALDRIFRGAPTLHEDRLRHFKETYCSSIGSSGFCDLTGEPPSTYVYLTQTRRGGRHVSLPLEQASGDELVPGEVREAVAHLVRERDAVRVADAVLPRNRADMVAHVAEECATDLVPLRTFFERYQAFLAETGLDHDERLTFSGIESFGSHLGRSEKVLRLSREAEAAYGGSVRYYNSTSKDLSELGRAIVEAGYDDIACSAALLMADARLRDVLLDCDIRNEYELHTVLRRFMHVKGLKFGKPPMLEFGNATHDKQVNALVCELSPVTGVRLAEEYERRYGVAPDMFWRRLRKYFRHYRTGGDTYVWHAS